MSRAFELSSLRQLADHLAARATVIAPMRGDAGWNFEVLEPGGEGELELCHEPSQLPFSAKAFFFAERESLFVFEGGRFRETLPAAGAQVLFGLLPCDAAAVAYQDRFFAEDRHYRARREGTLLVAHDCASPCAQGFCVELGTGPSVVAGAADLIVQPGGAAGAGYTLIAESAAGLAALEGLALKAAAGDWRERREQQARAAADEFEARPYLDAGIARLNAGDVQAETWEALGLRCIACNGCTIVCPTCSCFTAVDMPLAGEDGGHEHEQAHDSKEGVDRDGVRRLRLWDSCLLEGFQREASGHHPAPTAGMRLERFYQHKFGDAFVERFAQRTCVGCGRCEAVCPGVVGVHSTLKRIASA